MGEVYRARDSRLRRDVAVKVLPTHLSSDPGQKRRLEREAQSISALNHPNICQLYDVGSQDGIDYIVMEFIDGETIAARLIHGPLPLKQALKIAIEIGDALDKAHARDIIHRDLKTGNVMLTRSGVSKLMDFGLAKSSTMLFESGAAKSNPLPISGSAQTVNIASPSSSGGLLTEQGTIVGTFAYMAPELLHGSQADVRSDIYGFGCVLYEMITGKRPFAGSSQLGIISAILEKEPEPLTSLQPLTPPLVEHVVLRCLAKDPDQRWQTIRDLVSELKWAAEASESTKEAKPAPQGRRGISWGIAAVLLALLSWLGFARWIAPPPHRQPLRLSMLPPTATSFVPYSLAISPDGQRVAFVAAGPDGATALWVRTLANGSAQQIAGTENAVFPFWSADSREIGFSSGGKLKRADPSTGAVQVICNVGYPFGNTWNGHGTILFAGRGGLLYKVDALGGEPQPVTRATVNESHRWPSFLPDQDHFLYFLYNPEHSGVNTAQNGIYVGSLNSTENKRISSEIANAVQFASGHLFFVRDRSLMAQPFDLKKLELTGKAEVVAPEEIEEDPAFANTGFSVSANGVVVFQSAADNFSRLSWFDRQGNDLGYIASPGYRDPSLSGDGSLLAITADDQRNGRTSIRIYDFARSTSTLVSDGGKDVFPALSHDGKTVAYSNSGANTMSTLATDNSSQPQILASGHRPMPNDWSKDGRYLVYMYFPPGATSLAVYDLHKHSGAPYGLGAEAQFSPDSKWIAFTDTATGREVENYVDAEIFVTAFPTPAGRIQISNNGGAQARWRADGKELYYIGLDKKLMAVSIDTSHGKLEAGVPHALFQTRIIAPRIVLFQYAVSPDGKRFLINSLPAVGAAPVTVLIN